MVQLVKELLNPGAEFNDGAALSSNCDRVKAIERLKGKPGQRHANKPPQFPVKHYAGPGTH